IREQVRHVDAHQPVRVIRTAEEVLAVQGWARERFVAILLFVLAAVALLVGALGLYSVVSYSVSHRLREFAIRIAVGAGRTDVVRLAVLSPLASILAGLAIGISGSVALNRALRPWSIGNLSDPVVLAAISAVLLAMTVATALIP